MRKVTRTCCLLLVLALIFLIGWWRHHEPSCDDDDWNHDDDHGHGDDDHGHDDDDRGHDDDHGHGDDDDKCTFSPCIQDPFKSAQAFSLYSSGSVISCNAGVEGRIAANGPVNLESFSAGLRLSEPNNYTLISSNIVEWSHGSAWHGAVVGSSVVSDYLTLIYSGVPHQASSCCSDDSCGLCTPGATKEIPFNFTASEEELLVVQSAFDKLPHTSVPVYEDGALILNCPEGANFSIFSDVNATEVTEININCPNQTVLIKYLASVVTLNDVKMTLSNNTSGSQIIHYFKGETLTITGAQNGDVFGAVFAPKAKLSFSESVINGNVITASYVNLSGGCNNGKISYVPFTGCIPLSAHCKV